MEDTKRDSTKNIQFKLYFYWKMFQIPFFTQIKGVDIIIYLFILETWIPSDLLFITFYKHKQVEE